MILKAVTKRLGWGGWTVTFGDVRAFWRMCAEWEAFSISGRSGSNDMSRLRGLRAAVLCSELAPVPVLTGPPLPCVLGLLSWKDSLSERVTAVWMVPSRSTSPRPTAPLLPVCARPFSAPSLGRPPSLSGIICSHGLRVFLFGPRHPLGPSSLPDCLTEACPFSKTLAVSCEAGLALLAVVAAMKTWCFLP